METRRKIILGLLIFGLVMSIGGFSVAFFYYRQSEQNLTSIRADIHLEVVRIYNIEDGTPLKAIFMIDRELYSWQNHSAPLIVLCHGMVKDYLQLRDLGATLVAYGYGVLLLEARGHGSNPAPSSLAYFETSDILLFLDYMERREKSVDVSNAGIYGQSMGGLYATMAYITESQGQGRFQALVETAGPINLTREINFMISNPSTFGSVEFLANTAEKDPINFVNQSFPSNILMMHDRTDPVVDYQCAVEFYTQIDPLGTRTDVEFISLDGFGHSISEIPMVMQRTVAWFERYLHGNIIDYESILLQSSPLDLTTANISHSAFLLACIGLMLMIPCFAVFNHGDYFTRVNLTLSTSKRDSIYEIAYKEKLLWIVIYWGIWLLAGLIGNQISLFIFSKLLFGGLSVSVVFILLWWRQSHAGGLREQSTQIVKESLNLHTGLLYITAIGLSTFLYIWITGSPQIEDVLLVPGGRRTYWIIVIAFAFMIQLITNILFIRLLFPTHLQMKHQSLTMLREGLYNGILYAVGILLFFIWDDQIIVHINVLHLDVPLRVTLAIGLGVVFCIYNLIIWMVERMLKSILPAAFVLTLVIGLGIAASNLVFVL